MHSLSLVSTVEPVLRDLLALSLSGEEALVLTVVLRPQEGDNGVIRLMAQAGEDDEDAVLDVQRTRECWTCSLREVLLAVLEDRTRLEPDGSTVVLLPPTIELVHLVPGLDRDIAGAGEADGLTGARLAGTCHVINADTAAQRLLEHHPLAGSSGWAGDDRCTEEVHVVGLGYADLTLVLGADPVGADLIEHLCPHDSLLLTGLDAPLVDALLGLDHDVDAALARIHPASTQAWGGPDEHGVRTLDLASDLPFHPGRLRELVAELAGQGMLARGCFWLPTRPGRVCSWEVAGGVVSVGDAGTWEEAPRPDGAGAAGGIQDQCGPSSDGPRCHLVVTGVADDAACERVRAAFGRILLRPDELEGALAWAGSSDGLEDWFGEED